MIEQIEIIRLLDRISNELLAIRIALFYIVMAITFILVRRKK